MGTICHVFLWRRLGGRSGGPHFQLRSFPTVVLREVRWSGKGALDGMELQIEEACTWRAWKERWRLDTSNPGSLLLSHSTSAARLRGCFVSRAIGLRSSTSVPWLCFDRIRWTPFCQEEESWNPVSWWFPPPPLPPPSPCLSSGEFTQSQGLWPSGIYPLGVHPGMATILTWCWSIGRQASLLPAPGPFRPGAPLLFLCHFLEKWESPSCFLVMLEYGNCCGCDILSFSLWVYPLLQNPPIRNLIMSPPNSYIDTLTPNETVYGDRAFKEIIRVKCGPKGGALIQ